MRPGFAVCALLLLVLFACSGDGEAGMDPRRAHDAAGPAVIDTATVQDASHDARTIAVLDAATDAGTVELRCYVYDDCNGGKNNDYSAGECPGTKPALGTPCALTEQLPCYYCPAGRDALHWYLPVPVHRCVNGAWSMEEVSYTCE